MRSLMLFFVVIVLIVSCKESTDMFYEKKDKILGQWRCTAIEQEITNGLFVLNDTTRFNILLNNNEEVVFTYDQFPGFEEYYKWYYQYDPEKVIIVYSEIGILIKPNNYFNVIINEHDLQQWEEIKYTTDPPSENDKITRNWNLTRY